MFFQSRDVAISALKVIIMLQQSLAAHFLLMSVRISIPHHIEIYEDIVCEVAGRPFSSQAANEIASVGIITTRFDN